MKDTSISAVKELRARTGAGLSDCKKALAQSGSNIQSALAWLKEQGLARMAKRAGNEASEGKVASYIHAGGRIGVLLEVNTETDFSARSTAFQKFVKNLTLHITAMNPLFISESHIPKSQIEEQEFFFKEQALKEGKPSNILNKIAEGQMEKWKKEKCLMSQIFFHPDSGDKEITVEEALAELVTQIREKIVIRRFARYELGQN